MSVIVNADDFGYSQEVNRAIGTLVEKGQVTSTTILANGPAFEDAARMASSPSWQASVGVHLNLSEFTPLTDQEELRPYLDETGRFTGEVRGVLPTPSRLRAIRREWSAQIDRVRRAGLVPSHLDSHRHVHRWPPLLPATIGACRAADIDRIRRCRIEYRDRRSSAKRIAMEGVDLIFRRTGLRHPDRLLTLREAVSRAGSAWPENRVHEVMTHPGHPEHPDDTAILDRWADDISLRLVSFQML